MIAKLKINNRNYEIELQGHELLIEVLREALGLTGTKLSCNEAECGACTVLVNNKAVLSCITLAADVIGADITTVEGLASDNNLHPIQQAFLDKGAIQCGFCIPGMVLATKSLLDKNPKPNKKEIEYALDGNLCRCSGYLKIFDAVEYASQLMDDQKRRTSDE